MGGVLKAAQLFFFFSISDHLSPGESVLSSTGDPQEVGEDQGDLWPWTLAKGPLQCGKARSKRCESMVGN